MSQDNNQKDRQNREGQGDNWQGESQGQSQGQRDDWQGQGQGDRSQSDTTRESRSSGYQDSGATGDSVRRQDQSSSPELDDMDEMDEDRDDDDRGDGSPNRRNNIG
jgi:hypothetical protein